MAMPFATDVEQPRTLGRGLLRRIAGLLPKGLFARSLLIVILPILILQSVLTYVFFERHWQLVTRQLSTALTQDIAALIDIYQSYPQDKDDATLTRIAQDRMNLQIEVVPKGELPPPLPKPFLSIVDAALSDQIRRQIGRPFWLDTVGRSNLVEIRIQLDDSILRVIAQRGAAYASNSYIFLLWMLGTSTVLVVVSIVFLRNQIRPILQLARAAESFGKGREVEFRPLGALEVRQAGYAFLEMRRRIERAIEQRTTMLNGVSHDLRTILTRFKLSIEMLRGVDRDDMRKDVEEMQRMLEAYLAFARGDAGENTASVDMRQFLEELRLDAERGGTPAQVDFRGESRVAVRPDAFRRCLANLIGNAQTHAGRLVIDAARDQRFLTINVDDDGPGIPADRREDVFRPFFRLDEARTRAEGSIGTGLGLAIARDIARSHGGDITLGESPMGGLRATVRVPV